MASAGEMQHSAGNDEARRAEEGLARPRMPTRVYYLDPGLRTNVGHYANYCRYIVGELRGRGVEVLVFAHRDILLSLQKELGAVAHFQIHTHTPFVTWDGWRGWLADFATYCRHFPSVPQRSSAAYRARSGWRAWRGWLTRFAALADTTLHDLRSLPAPRFDDLVILTDARPAHLWALLQWRRSLPRSRRPAFVVESIKTGLRLEQTTDGIRAAMPDPRLDPTAAIFRYLSSRFPREPDARFHLVTFAKSTGDLFKMLLHYPVHTLPLPYRAVAPLRNRAGARPIVVAILGFQRAEKGYDRMPEIVTQLLRSIPEIRVLIQNPDPLGLQETQQSLREIAANSDRVILEEVPADGARWIQLLGMSDLVLCPHRTSFYMSFSSVVAEALANGIPVVVPAGTPLEAQLEACGRPGAAFARFDPASIAETTKQVLAEFDRFATAAHQAAVRWPETNGPARFVDRTISLIANAEA